MYQGHGRSRLLGMLFFFFFFFFFSRRRERPALRESGGSRRLTESFELNAE